MKRDWLHNPLEENEQEQKKRWGNNLSTGTRVLLLHSYQENGNKSKNKQMGPNET